MSERRPLAVLVYCAAVGVLTLIGLGLGILSLTSTDYGRSHVADNLLAFSPLAIVAAALFGFWRMRWWGVVVFWLLVVGLLVAMLLAPGVALDAWSVNAVVWIAMFVLPPTLIARKYRRQFR